MRMESRSVDSRELPEDSAAGTLGRFFAMFLTLSMLSDVVLPGMGVASPVWTLATAGDLASLQTQAGWWRPQLRRRLLQLHHPYHYPLKLTPIPPAMAW